MEVYLTIRKNVSSQSTLYFWENPLTTKLALNFLVFPSTTYLILYNHLELITNFPFGLGTMS